MKMVNWSEYEEALKKLHKQLELHEFDDMVAIGRGGSIVAAYLSSKMGVPVFHTVFIRHSGHGRELKIIPEDLDHARFLRGRLLLVDDSLIDGRAMRYVLDLLPKTASVVTSVAFCRKGSNFKPEFVGEYTDEKERQIIFPYDPVI